MPKRVALVAVFAAVVAGVGIPVWLRMRAAPEHRFAEFRDGGLEVLPLVSSADTDISPTLFADLPAARTGLDFQMQLPDAEQEIRALMFLSTHGGICTGDYDGDGLSDIYVTSPRGSNRLFRNLGDLKFADVTEEVGLFDPDHWGTGATFVDIDNDGDLDIYACGYRTANRLYINHRDRTGVTRFQDEATKFGLDFNGGSMTMAFADIDNDGDLDGYLATTAVPPPAGTKFEVMFVTENGKEKPVVLSNLKEYWDLIHIPGDPELGTEDRAQRVEAGQYDHLLRNDDGKFVDVSREAGIDGNYFTLSATWWDYDQDGYPDLYVSNDYTGPDQLYHNNGDGTFHNVIEKFTRHTPWFSMGSDVADLNNDGWLDFLAADMSATTHYRDKIMMGNMDDMGWFLDLAEPRQYMRNALYINSGRGAALEVARYAGLSSTNWTWTPRLADFDNDGWVDLFATNGIIRDSMNSDLTNQAEQQFAGGSAEWAKFWAAQPMHKEPNMAFRNNGHLKFESVGPVWGLDRSGVSFGAATADFDNDGDLDLVVSNADAPVSFYENKTQNARGLRIALRGTRSNRFGVGARVVIEFDGMQQTQVLTLSRGWLSACEPLLHFGTGSAAGVDRIVVYWPSGHRQEFKDVDTGQLVTITEPSRRIEHTEPAGPPTDDALFAVAPGFDSYPHRENSFDDFQQQPLLPNRQSQWGPALAMGDVDGDGDMDGYFGGAHGQGGQLLTNTGDKFESQVLECFAADADHEDVDAEFADVDGDGDLDLYVVSGSSEFPAGDPLHRDRVYLNDGRGGFTYSETWSPNFRDNGSVARAADFDGDGDLDLFVGGRALPGEYPRPAHSRLLVNDGTHLVERDDSCFTELGIVTDAAWVDLNGDSRLDLVVTTDWGPVVWLRNDGDTFVDATEATTTADKRGWWNAVSAGDIDGDGDIDLAVGNFGLNTKYKASAEKPELLYYGDFDGTGKAHLVEAKYEDGRCLPRRGFSCSQNAMPFLRSKMETYHNFAIASLTELYDETRLERGQRFEANTLESGVLLNDGSGQLTWTPLAGPAQFAPCMDLELGDANGDGHLDVVMAQNFYGPQRETGWMDGGLSLVLLGDGQGNFEPLDALQSGVVISGDARRVKAIDLEGDGQLELIFGIHNGQVTVFRKP